MTVPTISQAALPTQPGVGLAVLRVILGTIFIYHGADKLFGGLAQTTGFFGSLGIPAPALSAWLVALVEFGGGLALLLGLLARPAAALLIPVMVVAVLTVHGANGFANTNIVGMGEAGPIFGMPGWEYHLTLIGGLFAVLFGGAGRWALRMGGVAPRSIEGRPAHA